MTDAPKRLRELRDRQSKERGRIGGNYRASIRFPTNSAASWTGSRPAPPILSASFAPRPSRSKPRKANSAPPARLLARRKATARRASGYWNSAVRFAWGATFKRQSRIGPLTVPRGELNAAVGIGANRFPLELLAAPERRVARTEDRETTAVDIQTMPRTWLDRLFAETAAMRLGISMESVPAGSASFPVTTAGAVSAQRGKDQAAADTAWTVAVTELKPKRNAATLKFSIEDTARIPGLESALTRDLRMALTEGVDRAIFIGDSGATPNAGDILGLQAAAITETTLSQASKIKGPETLEAFTGMVDGIHANTLGDLNIVAAVGAYRLWENTIINVTTATNNQTLAAFLRLGRPVLGGARQHRGRDRQRRLCRVRRPAHGNRWRGRRGGLGSGRARSEIHTLTRQRAPCT